MKLDEIKDIEILRNELKETMIKCVKSFKYKKIEFNESEYYYIEHDDEDGYNYIYDAVTINNHKYIKLENHCEAQEILEKCFNYTI